METFEEKSKKKGKYEDWEEIKLRERLVGVEGNKKEIRVLRNVFVYGAFSCVFLIRSFFFL